ncbi:hypothetical protein CEUSTIGMA_g4776.t1 [Chlamydomonas eustigma]|uniref:Uncharacterized protein n=1 Tax=Chlamydomonas eustigma TaxID=1157962 RepID=A0A250X3I3_9CHLO|nr:hypothetical protein CEUSTIGMA_g4776.t1 [Chlamydomonas eustigma]|eukprot:GAX77330.1 hypothetical protein CEUSTIGMA_g4776.t1 [Chlamydomonas eustigma]
MNMDPKAAAIAMEQMKKMSPEQMQEMMRMAQMNPDMMRQAMNQMNNMRPDDWARASEHISNMSASDLQRQAAQAQQQLHGQQQYVLNASKQLKAEGNALHNSGKYKAAAEKYERAKENVKSFESTEAVELQRSCMLNLSSCYLNLKEYSKCIQECSQVLDGDRDNLKALYRRGQAYLSLSKWGDSASDLERAVRLSNHDPDQQRLIREKLQQAQDQLSSLYKGGVIIEDVTEEVSTSSSSAPAPVADVRVVNNGAPSISGTRTTPADSGYKDMAAEAARMMSMNPEMAKIAAEMMKNMPPEQLAAMTEQAGLPGGMKVTPEMARMAADSLSSMSPEDISRMAEASSTASGAGVPQLSPEMQNMASEMMSKMSIEDMKKMQEMASNMGLPGSSVAPSASATGHSTGRADDASSLMMSQSNASTSIPAALSPNMAKMAAEMMGKMKPDELAQMTEMAAKMGSTTGFPGSPGMPQMTPDMVKMASQMMANMKPEDMEKMSKMAASMGMPGPGGAMPSNMDMGDMAAKMNDPAFMESAMAMMKNMDEASISNMMMSSGMCKSKEQAEAMAKQMKGMNDSQMKMMLKAAQVVQSGAKVVQKTKDFILSKGALLLALLLLLIAVILRFFGVM